MVGFSLEDLIDRPRSPTPERGLIADNVYLTNSLLNQIAIDLVHQILTNCLSIMMINQNDNNNERCSTSSINNVSASQDQTSSSYCSCLSGQDFINLDLDQKYGQLGQEIVNEIIAFVLANFKLTNEDSIGSNSTKCLISKNELIYEDGDGFSTDYILSTSSTVSLVVSIESSMFETHTESISSLYANDVDGDVESYDIGDDCEDDDEDDDERNFNKSLVSNVTNYISSIPSFNYDEPDDQYLDKVCVCV